MPQLEGHMVLGLKQKGDCLFQPPTGVPNFSFQLLTGPSVTTQSVVQENKLRARNFVCRWRPQEASKPSTQICFVLRLAVKSRKRQPKGFWVSSSQFKLCIFLLGDHTHQVMCNSIMSLEKLGAIQRCSNIDVSSPSQYDAIPPPPPNNQIEREIKKW